MCVGHYVDHNGPSHPIDLEIEDVYRVPQCPLNVLATPCIAEQNICLYTGPGGNELYMPGFADQTLGRFDKCTHEMVHDGNLVIVFNLGKGRPIMSTLGMMGECGHICLMCCTTTMLHVKLLLSRMRVWSMSLPPPWLTLPMGTVVMQPCNSLPKLLNCTGMC